MEVCMVKVPAALRVFLTRPLMDGVSVKALWRHGACEVF